LRIQRYFKLFRPSYVPALASRHV